MGKLVIEKWQCDRCKKVDDEKPGRIPEIFAIRASHELEWAGGVIFEWKELCLECNSEVGKEIDAMRESAKAAGRRALSEGDRHAD